MPRQASPAASCRSCRTLGPTGTVCLNTRRRRVSPGRRCAPLARSVRAVRPSAAGARSCSGQRNEGNVGVGCPSFGGQRTVGAVRTVEVPSRCSRRICSRAALSSLAQSPALAVLCVASTRQASSPRGGSSCQWRSSRSTLRAMQGSAQSLQVQIAGALGKRIHVAR